jgi:hypothetical protein
MAIRPDNSEDYNSLGAKVGRTKKAFDESTVGVFTGDFLNQLKGPASGRSDIGHMLGWGMGLASIFVYGLAVMTDENVSYEMVPPAQDEFVEFSTTLDSDEYMAISSDNGQTGYALFQNAGQYSLYEFDKSARIDGQIVLDMVEDADDAWHAVRIVSSDLQKLSAPDSDNFSAPNWEVYSFDTISQFVVDEETGEIDRFASDLVEMDSAYTSIDARYSSLSGEWSNAATQIRAGKVGMDEDYILEHAAEMQMIEQDNDTASSIFLASMFGLGTIMLAGGSIGPTKRRRKEILDRRVAKKNSMQP